MLDYRKIIIKELASMTDAQAADFNETVMRTNLAHIQWFEDAPDTDTLLDLLTSIMGQLNIDKVEERDVRAHLEADDPEDFERFEQQADDQGIAIMEDEPIKESVPPSEHALYMRMIKSILSLDAEGARLFASKRAYVKAKALMALKPGTPFNYDLYDTSVLFNFIAEDRGYVVGIDAESLVSYANAEPKSKVSDMLETLMECRTGDDFHPDILEQLKSVPVRPSVRERLRKFLGK